MLSPEEVYPVVQAWVLAMGLVGHRTAAAALAQLVTALLLGQSLWSASLMRAVGCRLPVPARQRYRRVARAWTRPWLTPAWLTPRLVRAALALVAPEGDEALVVSDSLCQAPLAKVRLAARSMSGACAGVALTDR